MVDIVKVYTANLTENMTSPADFFTTLNANVGYGLGIAIVVVIFFVIFIGLMVRQNPPKPSYTAAAFTSLLISYLLWVMNWLSTHYFVLMALVLVVAGIIMYVSSED